MTFNAHSELAGRHAFLSASSPHWLNYDYQKLEARYHSFSASVRGTDLHNLAHESIRLGIRLNDSHGAMAAYVSDALDFRMSCEVPLYYSDNAFGHADTLSFYDMFLRVHDLKTGVTPAKPRQLDVYAAYFCLEYGFSPFDIQIETRIYQQMEVNVFHPPPEAIRAIMDKTVEFNIHINQMKEAERWV